MVYSTRRFVLSLALCYFVTVFFSSLSIAITSLGEERANLSAFRTFSRFALVWFCLFPLPLGVWDVLRLVIVALPGLFSYLFCIKCIKAIYLLQYIHMPKFFDHPAKTLFLRSTKKFFLQNGIHLSFVIFETLRNLLFHVLIILALKSCN